MEQYILVCKYGARQFIREESNDMNKILNLKNWLLYTDKRRKGPGARLRIKIFQEIGFYANQKEKNNG